MKKIKLALLILGISVFASCSGDTVENTGATTETIEAKLTVVAYDVITGKPVDDAQVSLSYLEPVLAKDGIVSFNDVRLGTHSLKVEKAGYASISWRADINRNYISVNGTEREYLFTAGENTVEVPLHPISANYYGYIYYKNTKGQNLPAQGVTVYLKLYEDFVVNSFETQTDANGKYSFPSLPAGTYASVWAVAPATGLGGINFESLNIGYVRLEAGTNAALGEDLGYYLFAQNKNNANFEASYKSTVTKNENIEFTFTESIDLSSIIIGETVTVDSDATLTWEANKLTITPLHEWEKDIKVTFNNLKSTSGKVYNGYEWIPASIYDLEEEFDRYFSSCWGWYNFLINRYNVRGWGQDDPYTCRFEVAVNYNSITINLQLKDISAAVVDGLYVLDSLDFDYDAQNANLRWNLVEGATSYAIYRKNDKDSSYKLVQGLGNVEIPRGATIGHQDGVSLGGNLNGRTVSFIVQAKNNTSISLLDTDKNVKVFDRIKPTLKTGSLPRCLYFNEPVNRKTLSVSLPYLDITMLKDENNNDDETTVCINTTVAGTYTISGIADKFGNIYGTTGSAQIIIP